MSPADVFDEAIADMISDGVTDLFPPLIKMHFEKDETKKVIAELISNVSVSRIICQALLQTPAFSDRHFLIILLWELGLHVNQLQLSKL